MSRASRLADAQRVLKTSIRLHVGRAPRARLRCPHAACTSSCTPSTRQAHGYAAREVLAHGGCTAILTGDQARALTQLLDRCALGRQNLPAGLEADLSAALGTSEKVICCALTVHAHAE